MFIFFVNEETNPHILIANKVERLKKETGNEDLISWYLRDSKPRTKGQILRSGLLRPLKVAPLFTFAPVLLTWLPDVDTIANRNNVSALSKSCHVLMFLGSHRIWLSFTVQW